MKTNRKKGHIKGQAMRFIRGHNALGPSFADRFWEKADRSGGPFACWWWMGARTDAGYGQIWKDGKVIRASRASWEIHYGPIPSRLHVLHRCDNPPCVNPSHLFTGTDADNAADRDAKGRCRHDGNARGEQHWAAKLREADVLEVRRLYSASDMSKSGLARRFNVGETTISHILTGHTWAWLGETEMP